MPVGLIRKLAVLPLKHTGSFPRLLVQKLRRPLWSLRRILQRNDIFGSCQGLQGQSCLHRPLLKCRLETRGSNTQDINKEGHPGRFAELPQLPILDRRCPQSTDSGSQTTGTYCHLLVSLLEEKSNTETLERQSKAPAPPQDLRNAETVLFPADMVANSGSIQTDRGTQMTGCRRQRLVPSSLALRVQFDHTSSISISSSGGYGPLRPSLKHKPSNKDTQTKASSGRQEMFIAPTTQPTADEFSQRSASSSVARKPGQDMSRQAAGRLSSTVQHSDSDHASSSDDDSSFEATSGSEISHQPSSGQWTGSSSERTRQAKSENEPSVGHSHSHVYKERDKAKMKKKDDKTYRPSSKHMLATTVKEPSRAKMATGSRLSQRIRLPSGYVRSLLLSLATAFVRMMTGQLNRLRLVRRMLALVSFVASSGVSVLSVLITSTSWLFLLGLRLHSLALKEVTGSVHVAVCFLFPYCFQYLVSAIDDWAPHWLPACLWYSFLMQMFCTSNHQYKHSMSSHLVPALRALLPVAFLCEVPSARSYLLALGGSELLLLSFALAAVRLRCILSPIFLLSWVVQVFALATFGSSAGLQYAQLLVSLASLHAVSMVDVMLNSRFYHARYRAGMSLTNGFRTVSSPHTST
eukprot:g10712.t1